MNSFQPPSGEARELLLELLKNLAGPNKEWWLSRLRNLLHGVKKPPSNQHFLYEQSSKGWVLSGNMLFTHNPQCKFGIVRLLKSGETELSGESMRKRARELDANLSQKCAEYLLVNQKLIPESWRPFRLIFSGTCWNDAEGHLRVPFIQWDGKSWRMTFGYLASKWDRRYCLVRVCL